MSVAFSGEEAFCFYSWGDGAVIVRESHCRRIKESGARVGFLSNPVQLSFLRSTERNERCSVQPWAENLK